MQASTRPTPYPVQSTEQRVVHGVNLRLGSMLDGSKAAAETMGVPGRDSFGVVVLDACYGS